MGRGEYEMWIVNKNAVRLLKLNVEQCWKESCIKRILVVAAMSLLAASPRVHARQGPGTDPLVSGFLKATMGFGEFSGALRGPYHTLDGREFRKTAEPSFEIIFRPRNRISFGGEFFRADFLNTDFYDVIARDSFTYIGPDGNPARYEAPGTIFNSFESSQSSRITSAVLGNVYLNLAPSGARIQPFVGAGIGGARYEVTTAFTTFVHPIFRALLASEETAPSQGPDYTFQRSTESGTVAVAKGVAGLAAYITRHIAIRGEGGWRHGGYAAIGISLQ